MPDEHHEHRLVLVEDADFGFSVRWCLDCGLLFKYLDGNRYAEMVPEWSRERLEQMERAKEVYKYVTTQPLRPKKRLGRTLKELIDTSQKIEMPKLFADATKDGSTSNTR